MGNVGGFERLFSKLLHVPLDTIRQICFLARLLMVLPLPVRPCVTERDFITMNYLLKASNGEKTSKTTQRNIVQRYNDIDRNFARQMVVQWVRIRFMKINQKIYRLRSLNLQKPKSSQRPNICRNALSGKPQVTVKTF
jgi:hypothetical protein